MNIWIPVSLFLLAFGMLWIGLPTLGLWASGRRQNRLLDSAQRDLNEIRDIIRSK